MLDNALGKDGTMAITMPNNEFVATGCDVWALSG